MRFSIKHSLMATTVVALLLTALLSKSPALIEFATVVTLLSVPMGLVFAICDSNRNRRPFWVGFFVVSAFCCLFSSYTDIFHNSSSKIAAALCGPPEFVQSSPYAMASPSPPSFNPGVGPDPDVDVYVRASSDNYNERYNLVFSYVPVMLSPIFGMIGGFLAIWISRPGRDVSKRDDIADANSTAD